MIAPQKDSRGTAALENEISPENDSIESPAAFKQFVQRLNNFDQSIELVHYSGESAKFIMHCSRALHETKFLTFQVFADDNPYEEPFRLVRIDGCIYIQQRNVTPIYQSTKQYVIENIQVYAHVYGQFAGQRFGTWTERTATAPTISSRTDFCFGSRRRPIKANSNIIGETQYGTHIGGVIGYHQRMQRFLENDEILAGIVVIIGHPWNFQNHDENSVVLLYYERPPVAAPAPVVPEGEAVVHAPVPGPAPVVPAGNPNGARPSFGLILGRQLTVEEVNNLVVATGLNPNFLYGHGRVQRPGGVPDGQLPVAAGRCWFANPGDDDIYRFHIPARVLMVPQNLLDEVTIGGVHVDLNDLAETANLTINCKHLMQYVANGVGAMPVPDLPGALPIDLTNYGGMVNGDLLGALGPLGDPQVPFGQPVGGHHIGFIANAPGGTPLPIAAVAPVA